MQNTMFKKSLCESSTMRPQPEVDLLRFRRHSALFCHLLFIGRGAYVSQVLMASRPIIKDFNVIEYLCFSFFTGSEDMTAYFLLLQTAEEGLHSHIVVAISPAGLPQML